MKLELSQKYVIVTTVSILAMVAAASCIVLASILVLAKGNIALGIAIIVFLVLAIGVSIIALCSAISWKRTMKMISSQTEKDK